MQTNESKKFPIAGVFLIAGTLVISLWMVILLCKDLSAEEYNCKCVFQDIDLINVQDELYWVNYWAVCPDTNTSKYIVKEYFPSYEEAQEEIEHLNSTSVDCCSEGDNLNLDKCNDTNYALDIVFLILGIIMSILSCGLLLLVSITITADKMSKYTVQKDETHL